MITLFILNPRPLQYALVRYDAKIYDFGTQGWDSLPPTGIPAAANLQAMTPVASAGPLSGQQIAQVPEIVSTSGGIAFVTFTSDTGGVLTQVDCVSVIDLVESAGIRGGVSR